MKGVAELRKNVERIDQCCHELEDMIKACATYLVEYRSDWLHYMQAEKGGLSVAIGVAVIETTGSLDKDFEPKSSLAWALGPFFLKRCW